jgi:hypothetical protein
LILKPIPDIIPVVGDSIPGGRAILEPNTPIVQKIMDLVICLIQ